jgi:hypothetical protein
MIKSELKKVFHRNGERTAPCGTDKERNFGANPLAYETDNDLSERKLSIILHRYYEVPILIRLSITAGCHTLS